MRLAGKVALVTGAARGVGRSHAVRLAAEGADIVALDVAAPVRDTGYAPAQPDELAETVRLVEREGRRAIAQIADVRDIDALRSAVHAGLEAFEHIDVVAANAGIMGTGRAWEIPDDEWQDMLDVNLTGAWNTVRAVVPSMIDADRGGAIVITSSISGLKGTPLVAHYAAAKHGVVGLMRVLALELAPYRIRVNTVNPTGINTAMGGLPRMLELFEEHPDLARSYGNALPVDRVEPLDVSNAVLWLASDEARYVTGVALPVDAGALIR